MRNPSLFLLSIAVSVQLASAAPVPFEELAPVSGALKSAASALQGTTKGLSTGMAGGIGGMAGGMAALPKINKRQGNKSLDLTLAGVKPSDVMKVVQDPTTALQHLPLPVEGLTKRVLGALGGLGGLGGLLNGLPGLPQPKADPAALPPAPPTPPPAPEPELKEKGTDSSINIDTPSDNSTVNEAELEGLEAALEATSAARNGTDSAPTSDVDPETARTEPENSADSQSFSSPNTNTVTNSQDVEPGNDGGDDSQLAANQRLRKRVLEALMPKSKFQAEGLKNPEQVLKELGAADVIKTVIDAPDLTGMKAKRNPINPFAQLDSVSKTLNSAETLLKAVPLSAAT